VVKGFGKKPMMLLSYYPVNMKHKESIWRIVEIYLTRWKCGASRQGRMTQPVKVRPGPRRPKVL
jgi:hypothetical protein